MAVQLWGDTEPTEPGFYWVKHRASGAVSAGGR